MKSNVVASTAVAFVVTLILQSAVSYYASDSGTIGLSKRVSMGGTSVIVLTIENYSREFLENVAVEIPTSISLNAITSDSPVTFSEAPQPNRSSTRIVRIGQISPRLVTRLFIPLQGTAEDAEIRLVNRERVGLTLRKDDELESPLRKAFISGLITATLYAVFWVGLAIQTRRESDRLINDYESAKRGRSELRVRLEKVEGVLAKQRLLLSARLFDFSKELSFWRNAFRALVLQLGGEKKRADEVIETVTKRLGTHGTTDASHDFETIRIAAAWMADVERQDQTKVSPNSITSKSTPDT